MIQVIKKEDLFIVLDTVRDYVYPNLTKEEAVKILQVYNRDEDRADEAIPFEYYLDYYQFPEDIIEIFKEETKC